MTRLDAQDLATQSQGINSNAIDLVNPEYLSVCIRRAKLYHWTHHVIIIRFPQFKWNNTEGCGLQQNKKTRHIDNITTANFRTCHG